MNDKREPTILKHIWIIRNRTVNTLQSHFLLLLLSLTGFVKTQKEKLLEIEEKKKKKTTIEKDNSPAIKSEGRKQSWLFGTTPFHQILE